jgi:predicted alpha/beta-fold hydrolase
MINGTIKDTSNKKFNPAWWLRDGHSQTLWRRVFKPKVVSQSRQRIELDDGDFIDLDWSAQIDPKKSNNKTIVLILHGLCGCSRSAYIISLQTLLNLQGIASVTMNFRGCSGDFNRLATAYHSGISEDVDAVFSQLSSQYPEHGFVLVGYSLGANVILKYLGESQGQENIKKAVAVSTPFSLTHCSQAMLNGMSKLYGKYFVRRLAIDFKKKHEYFRAIGNSAELERIESLGSLAGISNIWEFDDKITAPLHGFVDAEDYYERCSSNSFLSSIKTDTLLVQSANDPLIPVSSLPSIASLPANVSMDLSSNGGHVGFICGSAENWLEHRILRFIED